MPGEAPRSGGAAIADGAAGEAGPGPGPGALPPPPRGRSLPGAAPDAVPAARRLGAAALGAGPAPV